MIDYIKSYISNKNFKSSNVSLIKFRFNKKIYLNLVKPHNIYYFHLFNYKNNKLLNIIKLFKKNFKIIKIFNIINKLNLKLNFLNKEEFLKIKIIIAILIKSKLIINFDLIKIIKYKFLKLNKKFNTKILSTKKFICNFYIKNYKILNLFNFKNKIYKINFIENFNFFLTKNYKINKKIKIKFKNLNIIKNYIEKKIINKYKIKLINFYD